MRHLNINWANLIESLDVWAAISPLSRENYLTLKPNMYMSRSAFGEDIDALVGADLLAFSADRQKVRFDPQAREFAKAMRAMYRHRFDANADERVLKAYVTDHLTIEESRCLLVNQQFMRDYRDVHYHLATQRDWPRQAIDLSSAAAALRWEHDRMPELVVGARFDDGAPYFEDERLFDATRALVEAALTWAEPAPLGALRERVPQVDAAMLYRAIMPAARYLWLFVWLEPETFMPVIGVWPQIAHLCHRPAPKPPKPIRPDEIFHAPLRIEDMVAVLIAAAAEPLRVLADGRGLYARDIQQLAAAIIIMPSWLSGEADQTTEFSPEPRVERATQACVARKLLEPREDERGRRQLAISEAGQAWVAMDPYRRIRSMLDPWRAQPSTGKTRRRSTLHVMVGGDFVSSDDRDESPWTPDELRWSSGGDMKKVDWRAAFVDALADCDGAFVPLDDLQAYHARVNNPLLGRRREGSYGPTPRIRLFGYYHQTPGELEREAMWMDMLERTIIRHMLPLGAIEMGLAGEDVYSLRLHAIGRYMLGLADDFDYEAAAEGDVIIAPNFEVTFLGPSPRAEAMVGRLAERTGSRTGTMFRLTRASCLAAAAAGVTADEALRDLAEVGSKPLPDNVRREVQGWFNSTRRVRMRHTWLIDAPDVPTAARIFDAVGKDARRLTETTTEITAARKNHAALIRKLKQAGIFVR